MEDEKIIALYFERDETAIRHTCEKYGRRLRTLSYGIVGDMQTAEECENDTYVEAWKAIPPHEPKDYFYEFLARMTRHLSLNCCRSRSRLKRKAFLCELSAELEQCIPASDDWERRIDDMVFGEVLNSFLASLSEEKRGLFLRRYWYLDSIAEIAKRFGFSESKVKTALCRIRRQLKQELEKEGISL